MLIISNARAGKARALIGAAMFGSLVGLVIGGAYLAGGLARASLGAPRAERLAFVASQGYSETALAAAAGDDSVLAIADRHQGATPDASLPSLSTKSKPAPAPLKLARASLPTAAPTKAKAANPRRDIDCLTQAVYYEARGEGEAGQAAVAQVILNRVHHPAFPKSVCGVVFQGVRGVGCQFSFACDGSIRRIAENAAWRRAREIAQNALQGAVMAQVGTATHFHAARVGDPGWGERLAKVAQIGAHIFYKFTGRKDAAPAPTDSHPVYASLSFASLLPGSQAVKAEPAPTTQTASIVEALATPASTPAATPAPPPAVMAKIAGPGPAEDLKATPPPAS
ncbi:MAG: cell wall hydrolase [Caulobacteraceae bacterium]